MLGEPKTLHRLGRLAKHNVVEAIEIDTGVAKTVASGVESPVPGLADGDVVCYFYGHELLCTRIADGVVELLSNRSARAGVEIKFDGLRPPPCLFIDAREHNKVVVAVADFKSHTDAPVAWDEVADRRSLALLSGGEIAVAGGRKGRRAVRPQPRAASTKLAGKSLYSVEGMKRAASNAFLVGQEHSGGTKFDLYWAEVNRAGGRAGEMNPRHQQQARPTSFEQISVAEHQRHAPPQPS